MNCILLHSISKYGSIWLIFTIKDCDKNPVWINLKMIKTLIVTVTARWLGPPNRRWLAGCHGVFPAAPPRHLIPFHEHVATTYRSSDSYFEMPFCKVCGFLFCSIIVLDSVLREMNVFKEGIIKWMFSSKKDNFFLFWNTASPKKKF